MLEVREREGDAGAVDVAEAAALASFDPSNEGERLRRYQSSMQREFMKTVETLDKRRLQQEKRDRQRAKMQKNCANEPNSDRAGQGEREHGSGTTRGTQKDPDPQIGANEPNSEDVRQECRTHERPNEPKLSRRQRKQMLRRRRGAA